MKADQKRRILVIDDDQAVCKSLHLILNRSGYEVRTLHHPNTAIEVAAEFQPELVLLDMNFSIDTSGKHGLRMLKLLLEQHSDLSIILITGWATLQLAVEGMKTGAKDFLAKPWDNKELLSSIKTVFDLYHQGAKKNTSQQDSAIIGESRAILDVLEMVDRVAKTDASVLITGESGTGKELIAEAIHTQSKRSTNSFVKVNLGGISTSLFESEMFGHVKGAYTGASGDRVGRFELAHRGTIFLDEIGELVLDSQVKLLRVLQEKTYEVLGSSKTSRTDCRVISATNQSLSQMVGQGTFREDLYYRINLIEIELPSLRDRKSDIPLLTKHFLNKVQSLYDIEVPYLEDGTLEWLSRQDFPGNIRQLKNLVERTALLHYHEKSLSPKAFQSVISMHQGGATKVSLPNVGVMTLDEMEKRMIVKALHYHNSSISQTSRSLGITRSSLYRRIEKYDIKVD